jgi:hypothetical protein
MSNERQIYPLICHEAPREGGVRGGGRPIVLSFLFNLGARWEWVINARPVRITPGILHIKIV